VGDHHEVELLDPQFFDREQERRIRRGVNEHGKARGNGDSRISMTNIQYDNFTRLS
jgi:hypothetical protein